VSARQAFLVMSQNTDSIICIAMKKLVYIFLFLLLMGIVCIFSFEKFTRKSKISDSRNARMGLDEATRVFKFLSEIEIEHDDFGNSTILLNLKEINSRFSDVSFGSQGVEFAAPDTITVDLLLTKHVFYSGVKKDDEFVYIVWPKLERLK
jgi:hypothetical protein